MATTTTTLEFPLRKPLSRRAKLLTAGAVTIALLLGVSAPAQAYSPQAKEPGCVINIEPDHASLSDCTVQKVYRDTRAKIETAMWSKDPALRAGTLNYLVINIIGNGILSFKKTDPARKPDVDLLNLILKNMSSAPTPGMVACYGNVALNYIANVDVNNQRIRNMYAIANAVKELKGKYGEAKGKAIFIDKVLRAFGDVPEMKKIAEELIRDKAKEKLKEEIKKSLGLEDLPLDRFTFYMTIIQKTQAPVARLSTDAQFKAELEPLTDCEVGLLTYPTGPRPKPKPVVTAPKYIKKTATQTFNGADLSSDSNLLVGGVSDYDSQHRGSCTPVGTALQCKSYDTANWSSGGNGPDDALRLNAYFDMPEGVKQAVPGSLITMQVTTNFADVQGAVEWEYGDYASAPKASGTNLSSGAQSQTLAVAEFNNRTTPNLDYFMRANSTMKIENVKITYTYTIKQ